MNAETNHLPYGPSQLGRVSRCPGSVALSREAPPRESSREAEEGTRLHAAVAAYLGDAQEIPGLSDDEQEAVDACVNFTLQLGLTDGAILHTEVTLPWLDHEEFGTADLVAVEEDRVLVCDWKFGRGELDRESASLQLGAYAVAASKAYGRDVVEAYLYQPRLDRRYHLGVEVDQDYVEALEGAVSRVIDRTRDPNAPRVPGTWCHYCPALAICPEAREQTFSIVERSPYVAQLSPMEVDELYEKIKAARRFLDALEPDVRAAIRDGQTVRYQAVEREGRRYVCDPARLYAAAREAGYNVDVREFVAAGRWSLSGAQKALGLPAKVFAELAENSGAVARGDGYTAIVKRKEADNG